jgi:NDP-sugar pyrophosphorylase family protein
MKAMVLAAGQGTRLRPITDRLPKALVPVAGRPMIDYVLRLLRYYGIGEVIINLHHLGEKIESYLGDGKHLGLTIHYSREPELLDTGGGLLKAKPFLEGGAFIVINTDALIDLNLAEAIAYHRDRQASATLVLRADENADRYGSMDVDANGRICRFLKAKAPDPPAGRTEKLMFTGVQILEPKVFDFMDACQEPRKFGTTTETYPRMVAAGEPLYGFRFAGLWQDLGTPERIKQVEELLQSGRAGLHYL